MSLKALQDASTRADDAARLLHAARAAGFGDELVGAAEQGLHVAEGELAYVAHHTFADPKGEVQVWLNHARGHVVVVERDPECRDPYDIHYHLCGVFPHDATEAGAQVALAAARRKAARLVPPRG